MSVNVVEEPLGDSLLEEFAEALQKGDGAVILSRCVVVAPRLGNDDNQGRLPRGGVVTDPNARVGKSSEVVLGRGPRHFEDTPSLAREARGRRVGGLLEVALELVSGEGVELPRGARGRIVRLVKADVTRVVDEEASCKEGGDTVRVEDQRAVSVAQRRDGRGFATMAPFSDVPDIGCRDSVVRPCAFGCRRNAAKGTEGVIAMVVRGIAQHLGGKGALISPPRMGVGARGPTAFHGHGACIMDGTL